jgi:hypothetical protein
MASAGRRGRPGAARRLAAARRTGPEAARPGGGRSGGSVERAAGEPGAAPTGRIAA